MREKRAWRRLAATMFTFVTGEDRARLDALLWARLREFVRECGATRLLAYAPMPDEPDLWPFIREWLADGGFLALPVWDGGAAMRFRRVTDVDRQLRPGRGGILEPIAACLEVPRDRVEFSIVPGRLFSECCERLGRGAGCYDVLLGTPGARSLGVAYDFQVFPRLPMDEHDRRVDAVMTPSRLIVADSATG